jgi:DNA-binding MarR family transcriptional regulator
MARNESTRASDIVPDSDFDMPMVALPNMAPKQLIDLKLGFLLHDVSRLRRSSFDKLMKPLGITRSQWWVIAHLSRHDGMMQTELAMLLDLGKVTLGGIVDRLEAAELVQRRPDATDRRAKRIYLTEKAIKLIRDMQQAETEHNRFVLKDITPDERESMTNLLSKMKSNLKAVTGY